MDARLQFADITCHNLSFGRRLTMKFPTVQISVVVLVFGTSSDVIQTHLVYTLQIINVVNKTSRVLLSYLPRRNVMILKPRSVFCDVI